MEKLSKNDQVIFWSAEEDFEDHRYQQALNKTERLSERYPGTPKIQILMASAMHRLKHSKEAYQIVLDQREQLSKFPQYLPTIFELLLQEHAFMLARELILQQSDKVWKVKVEVAENSYRQTNPEALNEQTKQFSHIGALEADKQALMINQAVKLPLQEYLMAAKALLSDPFGWQVAKTQVLLQLRAVGTSETISLSWLDKNVVQIQPNQLPPLQEETQLVAALNRINQLYAMDDPIRADLMEQELFTQANYIYPFFNSVIVDPEFWVTIIAANLFGEPLQAKDEKQRQMLAKVKMIYQAERFIKFV